MIASTNTTKDYFRVMECLQGNQRSLFKHNGNELRVRSVCSNTKLVQTRRLFKETTKTRGWGERHGDHGGLSVAMRELASGIRDNASDDGGLRVPL